jgi:3-oxoadipate enol-lactonase
MFIDERGCPSTRALVLLHGIGPGARGWEEQLAALPRELYVLAPDLPGFGQSSGPFAIDRSVADLSAALDERGVRTVDLCGFSLGACVALRFALARPSAVEHLIVCAGFARLPQELRRSVVELSLRLLRLAPYAFRQAVAQLVHGVGVRHQDAALENLAPLSQTEFAAMMLEAAGFDIADSAVLLDMPALVLCGGEDRVNATLSRRLAARMPSAQFRLIPDAGHFAYLDAPTEFAAALRSFIAADLC